MTPTSANPSTVFCLAMVTGSRAGPGAKLSNQSSSQDVSWGLFGKFWRHV